MLNIKAAIDIYNPHLARLKFFSESVNSGFGGLGTFFTLRDRGGFGGGGFFIPLALVLP